MTLAKTSEVNKQMMLTANGAFDTRIESGGTYDGLNVKAIADMVDQPQAREKADASFIIPSTYREHDGRSHDAQRANGEYHMLAIDVDEGNPSLDTLKASVIKATGDAAALIYSSSGASEANKKWRVLIPLSEPVSGAQYADMQLALFDLMRADGITCDPALARTGQPIYLPNVPPNKRGENGEPLFYERAKHRGTGYMRIEGSMVEASANFRKKNEELAERKAAGERQRRQEAREAKRSTDDVDPVQEFNARHTIADLFVKYGYSQLGGSQSYASPMQTSGSHATKNFETHWVSLSGSDAAAGIGQSKTGDITMAWGDAFDLYCYFEHSDDMTAAVRAYGKEIRPSPTEAREAIISAANDQYAYFDSVPMTEVAPAPATIITSSPDQKPIFWAKDAKPVLRSSYLIKNWLGKNQMSVVYGPSNVGKSFFSLDMSFCVAGNIQWQGCKVRGGPVLYLATEGGNAFQSRVVALREEYGVDDVPLAVRPSPIDLLRPEADLAALIELCKSIEIEKGEPIAMIVVDTLSRAMAGGDENGPTDMTSFIANLDALRDVTGAHIMIVHHSGKDTAKGARGHSSLRAATDTEIELQVEQSIRTATATKQRDLEPQSPIVFSLKVHELGKDEDGDPVTTCTIQPADADELADMQQKRPKGANQKAIVSAFKQLRGEGVGGGNPTGAGWPEARKFWCMDEDELRKFTMGKMTSSNSSSAYITALNSLIGSGYMVQNEGQIWISAKEGRAT